MNKFFEFIFKNKYKFLIIILYILFIFQMNNLTLFLDDFDYTYPIVYGDSFVEKFSFFFSKFTYIISNWSGRFLTHFVTISGLSFFGLKFYTFLTPFFVFLLSFICSKFISLFRKVEIDKTVFLISFFIITLNVMVSRESLYWASAGIPYVWGFILVIFFFYLLYKYKSNISKKHICILIVLLVLQAMCLEQYIAIVAGVLFCLWVESFVLKKNNKLFFLLFVITLILFLFSFFSTGNINRYVSFEHEVTFSVSFFENIYGTLYSFFRILTDLDICGSYFCFFTSLIAFSFFVNSSKKVIHLIPFIVILLGNVYFLSDYFGVFTNIFAKTIYDSFDIIVSGDYYNHAIVIVSLLYFVLYLLSVIFCLFKILKKQNYFLAYIWIVSLVSILLPMFPLRYLSFRYCLPFLFITFIFIVYLINNRRPFIYSCLFFLPFIFTINFVIIVFVFHFILFKLKVKSVYSTVFMSFLYLLLLLFNFIDICTGYKNNKVIHDYNEKRLLSGDAAIYIMEIPFKDEEYCYQTFYSDFYDNNTYYTFFNDWVNRYYGLDEKVFIIVPSIFDSSFL